jgi:ferredoxin
MSQSSEGVDEQSPARVNITLRQTGEGFPCSPSETLLQGMARLGRKGIPVGCLNGGCGVCKVKVVRGRCHETGAVSREHVTEEEARSGITLACRAAPETDVELEVIGKMQKSFLSQFAHSGKS